MKYWRASFVLALAGVLPSGAAGADRAPVLVELFTSEGSAGCLPADQLLAKLDATVIVLSEHVTLWDNKAWKDGLASDANNSRQQAYADHFRLDSPYTPQLVINGSVQFSGSDSIRANKEITKATNRTKLAPRLLWVDAGVQVEIDGAHPGDRVFLALADDSATVNVTGGENRGRQLHYVAACREIRRLGPVPPGGAFYQLVSVPAPARRQRVVLWVQAAEVGGVVGAMMLPPADQ